MFFIKQDLTHTINLHPSYFGPSVTPYLRSKLITDVEGTCTGRYGYIIAVVSIIDAGTGVIQPGNGMAEFEVKYSALIFKPFKGETLEGTVTNVNKMGFFTEVGPLQVFVSTHLIPATMKFDPASNPPRFATDSEEADELMIEKGTKVKLKVVGTRVDATEIFAIGTIKEDYLGPVMDL